MDTTHIYTLAHPVTGAIRYVGKANKLAARLRLHVRKDEGTKKSQWVKHLTRQGLQPLMEVLDVVPRTEWQFWEMYWIAQLKAWGHDLYNGDNGGLGSDRLPTEVREKIGDTLRGRPAPEKWTPVAQYDLQGNYLRTFVSYQHAAKAVGGPHANICRVQGKGLKAYGYCWLKLDGEAPLTIPTKFDASGKIIVPDEDRAKRGAKLKGRPGKIPNADTRAKMRAARLGVSPANKGQKATDEMREKNRASCPTRKKVQQLDLEGNLILVWDSIKAASIGTGATRAGIADTIREKQAHAAGYLWREL